METPLFKFLNVMCDDWLVAARLKKKGDEGSLKKLDKMEEEQLIPVKSLE